MFRVLIVMFILGDDGNTELTQQALKRGLNAQMDASRKQKKRNLYIDSCVKEEKFSYISIDSSLKGEQLRIISIPA